MMRLSMLTHVERTAEARAVAKAELSALERNDFALSIDGTRQDDAMLAVIKPVIERELLGRISSLDRDLAAYGVTVD